MKKNVLSIAFVILGTFAMAQQTAKILQKDPAQMEQKRAEKLAKMKAELNLSDAQVSQIKALQEKKMEERKNDPKLQAERKAKMEERKAKMEEMKAKKEQRNAEMKAILTPEQYKTWELKNQEKRKSIKSKQMKKMPVKASS